MERKSAGDKFVEQTQNSGQFVVYCATEERVIADFDGPNANTLATESALAHYASYNTPHVVLLADKKYWKMERVMPDGQLEVLTNAD